MSSPLWQVRLLVVLTAVLGVNYVLWRWFFSVNWPAWWIAVPLVIAETYSVIDSLLFGMTMWRSKRRPAPPDAPPDATVDVFITTYNEPLDLVQRTALAAAEIRHPHQTWILDDGNRPELAAWAEQHGIGCLHRTADWVDRPRHAKAGNINNALMATEGEFILILDADQVPTPDILDRVLGYFDDPRMALVQTPQYFVNVDDADVLGSQAPLFYGPIQQGKDGWNAAFFCGSNAVIRREALMQLGVSRYADELERSVRTALRTARKIVDRARSGVEESDASLRTLLDSIDYDARRALGALDRGEAVADVTFRFGLRLRDAEREVARSDARLLADDVAAIAALEDGLSTDGLDAVDVEVLAATLERDWSAAGALSSVRRLVDAVDVSRLDEAQPVMPLATISVTEDMATAMRLHGMGWRTAYHHEVLAHGLAPEDMASMLTQRLRWAQGTVQVMFRENPLVQPGLSWPQRLMYFATMWSYLSGFAAIVYIGAPVVYLILGVLPVQALSSDFFIRLVPFLVVNQLLFFVVGRGVKTWRGQQYSLALFPVWIKAFTSAFGNVYRGRALDFAVTPKTVTATEGRPRWDLIKPQLVAMGLLVAALVIGGIRLGVGQAQPLGTALNVVWVVFDLVILSIIIRAARYRGSASVEERTPA
ncbi:cellulose synthase (UDP-forming) [Aeromicrobium sp. SORGH_AS981]|uniref:glycosyltransferase n=1 Tax=Aeromicrobium sp. SORGH_AS_0981 TaxID=3041802 RepID=UPI0028655AD3|nr:glycosyltransferase [Aeromicrobium sp. SORGH_AS_0981]MDR6119334.1 cellulose synthase (UDP-forming) [Aeromicrobium sp. SORGH_AS_0981]